MGVPIFDVLDIFQEKLQIWNIIMFTYNQPNHMLNICDAKKFQSLMIENNTNTTNVNRPTKV